MSYSPAPHLSVFAALLLASISTMAVGQDCDPQEVARLLASDGAVQDFFAGSVCIFGDVAIIGAAGDDDNGESSGAAYVFRFDGAVWNEETKLIASDGAAGDGFGGSVSIDRDVALVGAIEEINGGSGSAYVYRFDGAFWNEEAKLTASDGAALDRFGHSVSIDGESALVGAHGNDDGGANSGSAYLYRFDGGSWNEEAKLTASDGAAGDTFGQSVSIDANIAVVGARADDDGGPNSGSAYLYRFDGASWNEEAKLTASDGAAYDFFGQSVSVDEDVALIGANSDDNENGTASGSAYVYRFDGASWNEEAKIIASDGAAYDGFGVSVNIDGDVAVMGAIGDDDQGDSAGAGYLYRFDGASWIEEAKLLASDGAAGDDFGCSVSIDDGLALFGAVEDEGVGPGSAYVFKLNCGQGPTLSILGSCPGRMGFIVEAAEANARIAYLFAHGEGSFQIPPGNPCSGTILGLNRTVELADVVRADSNGVATLEVPNVPDSACGRVYVQAIDLETCGATNVVLVN